MKIRIKYFDNAKKIEKIPQGDWIDLTANADMDLEQGGHYFIPLGVAMELPNGYEAHVAPRSSSFKHWGFLVTNSFGIIDSSYCGDNDQWFLSVYATRNTHISKGDRICQFRVVEKQPQIDFEEVDILGNSDRGGCGSTGVN